MTASAGNSSWRIVLILLGTCLSLLVLAGNPAFLLSSDTYLYSLAAATATPQNSRPEVDPSSAAAVSADVIGYIKGNSDRIKHASYFREEELLHLADVRHKVAAFHLFFYFIAALTAITFFIAFAAAKGAKNLMPAIRAVLFAAGAAATAISAVFSLLSLNFGVLFTGFHKILFGSSQWQFPSDYLLVNLFTEGFFAKFALDVVLAALIQGILLLAAAAIIGGSCNAKNNAKKKEAKA
ncbi:DUF1461 domain-containing protein [Candidatus Woesearchaeota archaeon]|nr:DUF1461 domain-containing protein [Candidatus Woesearchaeota archaeon]